jgi:dienelactone hydrolase
MRSHNFSPSVCHEYVASLSVQELAYDRFDEVRKWRRNLKHKLIELLGELPRQRIPLASRTLWKRSTPLGTIEKLVYSSEPRADIVAYLCIPSARATPVPVFICLQGHTSGMHNSIGVDFETESRNIQVEGDRDFALGCMTRGIAAFCVEGRGFGYLRETRRRINPFRKDVTEKRKDSCYDTAMQALLIGRTLAGERLYDIDRAIDYLETRQEVDTKQLGVMGMSGGGMLAIYAMGVLDRIQFAMPAGHFCSFKDSLLSKHHCGCCYVPGIYKYADMSDIAGLFAPKPVVVVTGRKDPSKPIAGVLRSFKNLKKIYADLHCESNCRLVVGQEGHRFYSEQAWNVMASFLG